MEVKSSIWLGKGKGEIHNIYVNTTISLLVWEFFGGTKYKTISTNAWIISYHCKESVRVLI